VREYGRFVVGLRLVDAAGVDLVAPQSAVFSIEPLEEASGFCESRRD
jgi:hypothetical protein